jgi:hypothetical protein
VTRKSAIAIAAAALIAAFASAGRAQSPPRHDAGLRIIHVPQGELAPRRVLPPANSAKRTVLNTPPGSLTPIRPTPQWRGIEKFNEPSPPPVSAAPTEPPPIADDAPPPAD